MQAEGGREPQRQGFGPSDNNPDESFTRAGCFEQGWVPPRALPMTTVSTEVEPAPPFPLDLPVFPQSSGILPWDRCGGPLPPVPRYDRPSTEKGPGGHAPFGGGGGGWPWVDDTQLSVTDGAPERQMKAGSAEYSCRATRPGVQQRRQMSSSSTAHITPVEMGCGQGRYADGFNGTLLTHNGGRKELPLGLW
ncbi:unnamed protein product [Boreogadus saida]